MARRGRPTVEIDLNADERKTLHRWARRHSSSQALALRCRIVLACAEGDRSYAEIAAARGCNPSTVTKWRHRFAANGLDGMVRAPPRRGPHDRRRRGGSDRGRDARDGSAGCDALVDPRARRPPGHLTYDRARDLAGVRAHALARGLLQGLPGPRSGGEDPRHRGPVHEPTGRRGCVRGRREPRMQALNRTAPTVPMLPTTPARATHDYERNGTCDPRD
jgi:DNA-binding CsgD family transcriptional regulator